MTDFAQSTAVRVLLKVYLTSDHVTPATGKTVAVVISKNGGAMANPSAGATNATEISNGWYYADLSTTDTGTLGPLIVRGTATACDDSETTDYVVAATNGRLTALPAFATGVVGGLPLSVDTSGRVDVLKINGTSQTAKDIGALVSSMISRTGTAQAGAASTVTLDAGASATDNTYRAQIIVITGGTGAGQAALIKGYVGSSKIVTVSTSWATAPDATSAFAILSTGGLADVRLWGGGSINATVSGRIDADVGNFSADFSVTQKNSLTAAATAATPTAAAVTGNVGGNVVGSVGSVTGLTASNLDVAVSAIKLKTDNLPAAPADEALIIAATNSILSTLGAPATASVSGDISALKSEADAIKVKTDTLPATPAATGDIPTSNQNADALLDRAAGVETNWTPRQALRIMLAALAGKLSGAGTTSITIRDTNDSKNRIVATVDASGDRSSVTLDPS